MKVGWNSLKTLLRYIQNIASKRFSLAHFALSIIHEQRGLFVSAVYSSTLNCAIFHAVAQNAQLCRTYRVRAINATKRVKKCEV